jgi:hypothetical protein
LSRVATADLLIVGLLTVMSGLSLTRVVMEPGWPMNHEYANFMTRTLVYAEHIGQGDLLPIWASSDNAGLGSAQPLLYHKLFYLLSGGLLSAIGNMKAALVLAVWVFLTIGSCGVYKLCRVVGCDRFFAASGGVLLIVANYTVTNWLVRGALAELSAAMVVPWVLALFVTSVNSGRLAPTLGLALGLVVVAHPTMALFLVMLLALTGSVLLVMRRLPLTVLHPRGVLTAGALSALVAGPYLLAGVVLGRHYDMTRLVPDDFLPENQIQPLGRYLWDTQWRWGDAWTGYTVQLDAPVIALLLVATGAVVAFRLPWPWLGSTGRPSSDRFGAVSRRPAVGGITRALSTPVVALVLIGGASLVLQTKLAVPFYRHLPGAGFIQFPWRLLAIMTPVAIAGAVLAAASIPVARVGRWLAALGVITTVVTSGAFAADDTTRLPTETVTLDEVRFSAFGEYVPVAAGELGALAPADIAEAMVAQGCSYSEARAGAESLVRSFTFSCAEETTVVLPLFSSPAHLVETPQSTQPCRQRPELPALCAVVLPAGTTEVRVHLPTFVTLLRRAWQH